MVGVKCCIDADTIQWTIQRIQQKNVLYSAIQLADPVPRPLYSIQSIQLLYSCCIAAVYCIGSYTVYSAIQYTAYTLTLCKLLVGPARDHDVRRCGSLALKLLLEA